MKQRSVDAINVMTRALLEHGHEKSVGTRNWLQWDLARQGAASSFTPGTPEHHAYLKGHEAALAHVHANPHLGAISLKQKAHDAAIAAANSTGLDHAHHVGLSEGFTALAESVTDPDEAKENPIGEARENEGGDPYMHWGH